MACSFIVSILGSDTCKRRGVVERTSSVREGCSDVVDGILVGPVARLLVYEEWVEEVFEKRGVGVDGDGVEGEYHWFDQVSGRP
jgi:hypothetical protein